MKSGQWNLTEYDFILILTLTMELMMKITMKQTLVAIALTGAFSVAQAQTTKDINAGGNNAFEDMGANPTAEVAYTVTHEPSSFNDVFTFSLTTSSDSVTSAVSLEQPTIQPGGFDYFIANGSFGLYSDADGDGMGGTLISSTTFAGSSTSLRATNLAAGSYYFAVAGDATGNLGGIYNFTSNTAPVPEPETYALMLAGLGLLGFVGKRRMRQSATSFA